MTILVSEEFERRYGELSAHIQRKAERREALFRANPFHPTLHTERLHPKERDVWSFRIDEDYRILFRFTDRDTVTFLAVGPHHWIYRYMDR